MDRVRRFNQLKNDILSVKDNELKITAREGIYKFHEIKKLVKDITNNKIRNDDVINEVKKIHVNKIMFVRNKNRNVIIILNH